MGDLCGEALAPILRPLDAAAIDDQIEGLKRVGLLVVEDGRVTTPNWDRYQPDSRAASRDRQEAQVSRGVPDIPGVSLGQSGASRGVPGHDDDDDDDVDEEQDLSLKPGLGAAVVAPTQTRARGPTPAAATEPSRPEPGTPDPTALRRVVDAYLAEIPAGQRGGRTQTTSSETSGLHELLGAHGEALVVAGIQEAARANTQERISVTFVASVCRRMAAGGSKPRAQGRAPPAGIGLRRINDPEAAKWIAAPGGPATPMKSAADVRAELEAELEAERMAKA